MQLTLKKSFLGTQSNGSPRPCSFLITHFQNVLRIKVLLSEKPSINASLVFGSAQWKTQWHINIHQKLEPCQHAKSPICTRPFKSHRQTHSGSPSLKISFLHCYHHYYFYYYHFATWLSPTKALGVFTVLNKNH